MILEYTGSVILGFNSVFLELNSFEILQSSSYLMLISLLYQKNIKDFKL